MFSERRRISFHYVELHKLQRQYRKQHVLFHPFTGEPFRTVRNRSPIGSGTGLSDPPPGFLGALTYFRFRSVFQLFFNINQLKATTPKLQPGSDTREVVGVYFIGSIFKQHPRRVFGQHVAPPSGGAGPVSVKAAADVTSPPQVFHVISTTTRSTRTSGDSSSFPARSVVTSQAATDATFSHSLKRDAAASALLLSLLCYCYGSA